MMALLLDSALKSTVILMLAWLASLAMRRHSADVRHRIWLAAILAVACMPILLSAVSPTLPPGARIIVASQIAAGPQRASQIARTFPWLFTIWASGATLLFVRLAIGMWRIGSITQERVSTPFTWGFFRPVIALPASAAHWTEPQREMVMRHERAHIERHDWLWQTLARVVTAVFWFHPLMWLASAELRRESELAVDDRVLSSGADPCEYAAHLLSVARQLVGPVPRESVAMVRKPAIENRIHAILDARRPRLSAGRLIRTVIPLMAAALIFPMILLQAQDVHKMGEEGLTPPTVILKTDPEYTAEARDAKIQGTVVLRCIIDEAGIAENIEVTRTLDSGLDTKAIAAVSQWRFAPGKLKGTPVRVVATIEVNFRLL